MTDRLYKAAIWTGGLALLAAAMIDTVAVLARNLATSLHGSIELIQVAILIAGALGLVVAVSTSTYARVHLMTDRLSGPARIWMDRLAFATVAIFFLCLLAGSLWDAQGPSATFLAGAGFASLAALLIVPLGKMHDRSGFG